MPESCPPSRSSRAFNWWPSAAWIGIGWGSLGLGNAINDGTYTPRALVLMLVGTGALVVGALGCLRDYDREVDRSGDIGVYVAVVIAAIVTAAYPSPGLYGPGPALTASRLLTLAAVLVATGGLLIRQKKRSGTYIFFLIVVLSVGSELFMIKASPHPAIDVWQMYQTATNSLLHHHNFYTAHWTTGVPWEVSNQFVYLPGSVVLLAPFKWLFGDVRVGLVAAFALGSVGVFRMTKGGKAWVLAGLVVLVPRLTLGIEQSWNDPLLLVLVVGAALASRAGRGGLAVLCFGAALASKQYMWLFIPAAAVWPAFGWRRTIYAAAGAALFSLPWIIASPRAFWQGAFAYNLRLPPRLDSLSLYTFALRHGTTPGYGLIAVGTLTGVALSVWLARSGTPGFLLGAGVAMAGFNLVNKQTFFNEWFLVIGLIGVAMALLSSDQLSGEPDPSTEASQGRTRSDELTSPWSSHSLKSRI